MSVVAYPCRQVGLFEPTDSAVILSYDRIKVAAWETCAIKHSWNSGITISKSF